MEILQESPIGHEADQGTVNNAPADLSGYLDEKNVQSFPVSSEGERSGLKKLRKRLDVWAGKHRLLFMLIMAMLIFSAIMLVSAVLGALITGRGNASIRFVPNE